MPRLPVRVLLCASSYSPLLVLLALRAWDTERRWAVAFLSLSIASVVLLWIYFWAHRRQAPQTVTPAAVQQRDGDVMGYVITYLVPFVNMSYRDSSGVLDRTGLASVCILFAVIVIIYVNANLIFINPILAVVGYRVYEIDLSAGGEKKALLTRKTAIATNRSLNVVPLGPFVLWECHS